MIVSWIKTSLKIHGQGHGDIEADIWHIEWELFGYANDSVLLLLYSQINHVKNRASVFDQIYNKNLTVHNDKKCFCYYCPKWA